MSTQIRFQGQTKNVPIDEETIRENVAGFLDSYHKKDRINDMASLIDSGIRDVLNMGNTLISHHDTINGQRMWLTVDPETGLMEAKPAK